MTESVRGHLSANKDYCIQQNCDKDKKIQEAMDSIAKIDHWRNVVAGE